MTTPRGSLRNFLEESPFHEFLESCWNGSYYLNFPVSSGNPAYDPGGVCAHALYYLVYAEKLGLKQVRPGRRRNWPPGSPRRCARTATA